MELRALQSLAFLAVMLVVSHAAPTPELYWKSMLPNTPMPKAVADILHPLADLHHLGVKIYSQTQGIQLRIDPKVAMFFLEKDMKPGKTMKLHFFRTSDDGANFLPRQLAESTPFSSKEFPELLKRLSIKPRSEEAKIIRDTISLCEASGVKGEEKACATSLESMIDFSISKLGNDVKAVSTDVEGNTKMQKYKIGAGIRKIGRDGKLVACHKQSYPYAVFYCHATENTDAYLVPLEAADGTRAKAVAVCHKNTSEWDPKHLAFKLLKIKPGTLPVCHFIDEGNIMWVRE